MTPDAAPVELELNHPLAVALRRQMKGDFMEAMANIRADSLPMENTQVVLFGSTLMHQLHVMEKVQLPFPGIRVSDVDMGLRKTDGKYSHGFEAECRKYLPMIAKQAVLGADFKVGFEQGFKSGVFKNVDDRKAIEALDPAQFSHDFQVYRVYTPEAALKGIESRRDKNEILEAIKNDPRLWDKAQQKMKASVKIDLTISPNLPDERLGINSLPFWMTPDPLYPDADHQKEGKLPVFRENILDMVAGKIVRAMTRGKEFKATDMLDIYSICDAQPRLIDLDSTGPGSDLETLRVLIINYIANSDIREPYAAAQNLKAAFANTPENRQRFITMAGQEIPAHLMPHEIIIEEMFNTAGSLVDDIFKPRPGKAAHGPLNYTDNDVKFAASLAGIDPNVALNPPPKPGRLAGLLSRKPRQEAPRPYEPEIRADYLQQEYPEVFKKYPEIAQQMKNNPAFEATIKEVRDVQMGKDRFGPE